MKTCNDCGKPLVLTRTGLMCPEHGRIKTVDKNTRVKLIKDGQPANEYESQPGGTYRICPDCHGSGVMECEDCDGHGRVECDECNGDGDVVCDYGHDHMCPECDGDGNWKCEDCDDGVVPCESCDGLGYFESDAGEHTQQEAAELVAVLQRNLKTDTTIVRPA